jgi:hypothetical protein
VHRTARAIAQRIGEILGEPDFPVSKVYAWRDVKKIRVFPIGTHIAARDDHLIEDLTGQGPATDGQKAA